MAFTKLHSSLVHSSLWCERDDVRLLFITMLAMCDRHGVVRGSRGGLVRLANIKCNPDEADPFEILMAPDNDSSDLLRNPDHQGRRIEEVPGGFRILNYEYYRQLGSEENQRERWRERKAKSRSRDVTPSHAMSRDVTPSHAQSQLVTNGQRCHAIADADADAEYPSAVSPEGRPQADPLLYVNNFDEAKRLICEKILNNKNPDRLWSPDAAKRLLKHLPMPRLEIERVAWFRNLPNDGSPELEARRPQVTETGLMVYWGDEVTRANGFWEKLHGCEKEKGAR